MEPRLGAAKANLARLTRKREALGAVNLRAEPDVDEVGREREALSRDHAGLETAIKRLRSGIVMLNHDGRFGVTMQENGVSQIVSVDLKNAEAMVA